MLQYNHTMNFLEDPQNQYLAVKRLSAAAKMVKAFSLLWMKKD